MSRKKSPSKLKSVEKIIPNDLSEKWIAVEAVATTFNTLKAGMFAPSYLSVVNASLGFLQKLHEQTVAAAVSHPQSDLIPELKALKEGRATDGAQANQI